MVIVTSLNCDSLGSFFIILGITDNKFWSFFGYMHFYYYFCIVVTKT